MKKRIRNGYILFSVFLFPFMLKHIVKIFPQNVVIGGSVSGDKEEKRILRGNRKSEFWDITLEDAMVISKK